MFEFPTFIPSIPLDEIKSYWLCVYSDATKKAYGYLKPIIRPCSLSRDQVLTIENNKKGQYVLAGACYSFNKDITAAEIILQATILGIIIDFIEIIDVDDIHRYKIVDKIDIQSSKSIFTGNKVDISLL